MYLTQDIIEKYIRASKNYLLQSEGREYLLSLFDYEKRAHFFNLLCIYKSGGVNYFKSIRYRVSREYLLELASSLVGDEEERLWFAFGVIGKRRFSEDNNESLFCSSEQSRVHLKELQDDTLLLKKELKTHFTYKRFDRNLNEFECFFGEYKKSKYAYMVQKNISRSKRVVKNYIIELSLKQDKRLRTLDAAGQKIDYLFAIVGKHYFENELGSVILDGDIENFAQNMNYIICDEVISDAYRLKSIFNEQEQKNLSIIYHKLYKKSLQFVEVPAKEKYSTELASLFIQYAKLINRKEHLPLITEYLVALAHLISDGEIASLLIIDEKYRSIFLSIIDDIFMWHKGYVLQKVIHIRTECIIENIKYLINTLYEMSNQIYERQDEIEKEIKKESILFDGTLLNPNLVSAFDFMNEVEIDRDLTDELIETEEEIKNSIYENDTLTPKLYAELGIFFEKYARLLNTIYEFKALADAINVLVINMKKSGFEDINVANRQPLRIMFGCIVEDLCGWRTNIMVEQCAKNIHYLDDSLLSSISQIDKKIQNIEPTQSCDEDDDFGLELF